MKQIVDQAVLLLYCMASLLYTPPDTAFVVALLITLIYVSISNIEYFHGLHQGFAVFFLIAAYFCPQCLLFTPAVFYSILKNRCYIPGAVIAGMSLWFYKDTGICFLIHIGIGVAFSALLWERTSSYESLSDLFKKTRDDSTELTLLLKEKNQTLLENQDYEVYTATLKERNRIAREIHDHVGHMLSRAILMVGAMKAVNQEETMEEPLKALEDTLNTAMTNIRESVHDLHDDSVNLKEVLEGIVKEYGFCPVELRYDMGEQISREVKYSFIAIIKEALHNVAKHSNATEVQVTVREHPALYQLVIEDNGSAGEERSMIENGAQGMGIQNMRDRIYALGGTMQVDCGKGFRVFITVPRKENAV